MDELTRKQELCLACKRCCREVGIYTHPAMYICTAEELIEFYEARGFSVVKSGDLLVLTLQHACPHLTAGGCDIYENRPKICREYSGLDDFGSKCLWSVLPEYKGLLGS